MNAPIAITSGDPAGVGPEVIAGALETTPSMAREVMLLGAAEWVAEMRDRFGCEGIALGEPTWQPQAGAPSETGARIAWEAMRLAADGCRTGRFQAVVTGPVSKDWLQRVGYSFPGQTEFFADAWGGDPTMAFVGERLRVVLATWHHPLREVPALLADGTLLRRAVNRAGELCQALGNAQPRIAVCGLNPHAGEGGLLGDEEARVLDPLLDQMREIWPALSTTLPGDTVFYRALQGEFDCVVALFHDQGLAPLKTVEFDRAVNLTLGLPHIRTSPDHGTAFSLAGQGKANPSSFREAWKLAQQLSRSA